MSQTPDAPSKDPMSAAGARIERDSFAIIDEEAGPHGYTNEQWPVVRRMIHASADFDFNGLTCFHPDAVTSGLAAIQAGAPIVCDVEMIRVGLARPRLEQFGIQARQFIADEDVIERAKAEETTRAVQAMRKAHRQGLLDGGIVAVGNAPTALLETLRLVEEDGARPALVVGMPVGFVSAVESKAALRARQTPPWVATEGRKGGSTLVVAAVNALMLLA